MDLAYSYIRIKLNMKDNGKMTKSNIIKKKFLIKFIN